MHPQATTAQPGASPAVQLAAGGDCHAVLPPALQQHHPLLAQRLQWYGWQPGGGAWSGKACQQCGPAASAGAARGARQAARRWPDSCTPRALGCSRAAPARGSAPPQSPRCCPRRTAQTARGQGESSGADEAQQGEQGRGEEHRQASRCTSGRLAFPPAPPRTLFQPEAHSRPSASTASVCRQPPAASATLGRASTRRGMYWSLQEDGGRGQASRARQRLSPGAQPRRAGRAGRAHCRSSASHPGRLLRPLTFCCRAAAARRRPSPRCRARRPHPQQCCAGMGGWAACHGMGRRVGCGMLHPLRRISAP